MNPFPFSIYPYERPVKKAETEDQLREREQEASKFTDFDGIDTFPDYPTRRERIAIEDAPAVPQAAWNVASRLRRHYDELPNLSRVAEVLRLGTAPRSTLLENWKKILEHDSIIAMHHRAKNLDPHGYGDNRIDTFTGVGRSLTGSIYERALRLFQEMQGMARYARTDRMKSEYPWTPEWQTPPGEAHEYGDLVNWHGTPKGWSGAIDPSKIRTNDVPFMLGPLGFYVSPMAIQAQGYTVSRRNNSKSIFDDEGNIREDTDGAVFPYQMPSNKGGTFWPMPWPSSMSGSYLRIPPPHEWAYKPMNREVTRRFASWFTDMAKKHFGSNREPFHFETVRSNKKGVPLYNYIHFYHDLGKLYAMFEDKYGNTPNKLHDLQNHLHTMALTAAGFDGACQPFEGDPNPNASLVHSIMPVAWNKVRRVRNPEYDFSPMQEVSLSGNRRVPKAQTRGTSRLPKMTTATMPRDESVGRARPIESGE
jgi:hypothetical protein